MNVCIVGTGACLGKHTVSNEQVVRALGFEDDKADWVRKKLGLRSRRFFHEIDVNLGRAIFERGQESGELIMSYEAAVAALDMAELTARELDGIYFCGCTGGEHHFGHSVKHLAEKLGMPSTAPRDQEDLGCGGFIHGMLTVRSLLHDKERFPRGRILFVCVNIASSFFNRELYRTPQFEGDMHGPWLSLALFGDGAGAVILERRDDPEAGILSYFEDSLTEELVTYSGGGSNWPPGSAPLWASTYRVSDRVKEVYLQFMPRVFSELQSRHPFKEEDIDQRYLHAANDTLVRALMAREGLSPEKTPCMVDGWGNFSAAGIPALIDEGIRSGVIALDVPGKVIVAAVGAPSYGGGLILGKMGRRVR